MKAHRFSKLASATIIFVFACAAIPAFAQRGGGSHGGGGGGFHGGGGGFHSGGGGFRGGSSSPPQVGAGSFRGAYSAPSSGANERSGGNSYHSYNSPANGNQRAPASSAPRAQADGQWHSFGGGTAGRTAAGPGSEPTGSANTGGGWQVHGGNRSTGAGTTAGAGAGTARSVRSFAGQGSDVWENAPAARNVVPASRTLSSIRGSFANTMTGNSGVRTSSSFAARSALAPGQNFGNSLRSNTFAGFGGTSRFGFGFNRFGGGFRGGCWNCGFGFGFGFGLGWGPSWGLGFGWPGLYWPGLYWNDPWWGWPGYGYYGYPAGYMYGDPYADNFTNPAPSEDYPDAYSSVPPVNQNSDQNSTQSVGVENSAVPVLLYLKDGSVYSARDYWVSGGQLRYILLSGAEGTIKMDQLDLQRTVNENAKSGVQFTLRPGPSSFGPARRMPPAATPAPSSQFNLASAPL